MNNVVYNLVDWAIQDESKRAVVAFLGEIHEDNTVDGNLVINGSSNLIVQLIAEEVKRHPELKTLLLEALMASIIQ